MKNNILRLIGWVILTSLLTVEMISASYFIAYFFKINPILLILIFGVTNFATLIIMFKAGTSDAD